MLTIPNRRYSPRARTPRSADLRTPGYVQLFLLKLLSGEDCDPDGSMMAQWDKALPSRKRDVIAPLVNRRFICEEFLGDEIKYTITEEGRTFIKFYLMEQKRKRSRFVSIPLQTNP